MAQYNRNVIEVTIENLEDVWAARDGRLGSAAVRRIVVPDAVVNPRFAIGHIPLTYLELFTTERR